MTERGCSRWLLAAFVIGLACMSVAPAGATDKSGARFSLPKNWTPAPNSSPASTALDDLGVAFPSDQKVARFAHKNVVNADSRKWREWITLRSYKQSAAQSPQAIATAVHAALVGSCRAGKHVTVKTKTPDPSIAASGYHVCAQLKKENFSHLILYKILTGPNRTYLMTRQRRAEPLPAKNVVPLAKTFPSKMKHWMAWYKSVRLNDGRTAKRSSGSAFAIGGRYLVTNEHVVRGCQKVKIAGQGDALLVARDKISDLALLRSKTPLPATAQLGGAAETRLGMPVMVAGYPLGDTLGNSLTVTTGTINGHGGLKGKQGQIRFDAAVQKGNSGGPLLSQSGHVIGVVRGILDPGKAQNVNFAITVPVVEKFLKKHSVAYQTAAPGAPLSPPDLAEKAKGFTAQVECWK